MKGSLLALALVLLAGSATAQPRSAPCDRPAPPAYAAPGARPAVVVWHDRDRGQPAWDPRTCLGWSPASRSRLSVALAGSFAFDGSLDELLSRIGSISSLRTLRYWSVTDAAWRPLVGDAFALRSPEPRDRRPDFAPPELRQGAGVYYAQSDSRSSAEVIYRMRVWQNGPTEAVVEMENVTPVRYRIFTLFDRGALQLVLFIRQVRPGVWALYSLTRIGEGASSFAMGHEASYVNRAAALYRLVAGVPSDQEPPVAP